MQALHIWNSHIRLKFLCWRLNNQSTEKNVTNTKRQTKTPPFNYNFSILYATCWCNQWLGSTSGSRRCRHSWRLSVCKCYLCCWPVPGRRPLHSPQCRPRQCGHSQSPTLCQCCYTPLYVGDLQSAARTCTKARKWVMVKNENYIIYPYLFTCMHSFSSSSVIRGVFLHLVTGCGVWHGLQTGRRLTDKDVSFTGDGPDGLFRGRTVDSSGVTAWHTQQCQLDAGRVVEADKKSQRGRQR